MLKSILFHVIYSEYYLFRNMLQNIKIFDILLAYRNDLLLKNISLYKNQDLSQT